MAINGLSNYANYYQNSTNKTHSSSKKEQTEKTKTSDVKLSQKAQDYLKDLQSKYGNMEIMVGDYETPEGKAMMARRNKEFNVLIDAETLEQMANDSTTRKKYEDILSNATSEFQSMTEELGEDAKKIQSFGITVDKDGIVSYFANILSDQEKAIKETNEAIDKRKENDKKLNQKKEKERLDEENKNIKQIKADSLEQLLEKIKLSLAETNNNVMTEQEKTVGQQFDMKF